MYVNVGNRSETGEKEREKTFRNITWPLIFEAKLFLGVSHWPSLANGYLTFNFYVWGPFVEGAGLIFQQTQCYHQTIPLVICTGPSTLSWFPTIDPPTLPSVLVAEGMLLWYSSTISSHTLDNLHVITRKYLCGKFENFPCRF